MRDSNGRPAAGGPLLIGVAALCGTLLALLFELLWPPQFVARALLAPAALASALAQVAPVDGANAQARLARLYAPEFLQAVVERGRLDVRSAALRMPLIGAAVARRHDADEVAAPPPGLSRFAWGGELLRVIRFDVDTAALGQDFELRADDGDRFALYDAEGRIVCAAQIGPAGCSADGVELVIAVLAARPGTRFTLRRVAPEAAAAELAKRMDATSFGSSGGLLAIELRGQDRRWLLAAAEALVEEFELGQQRPAAERQALATLDERLADTGAAFAAAQRALEEAGDAAFGNALDDVDARDRIATIAALEAQRLRALLAADDKIVALLPSASKVLAGMALDVQQLDRQLDAERELLFAVASSRAAVERELRLQVASDRYLALLEIRAALHAAAPERAITARVVEPARVSLAMTSDRRRLRFAASGALLAALLATMLLALRSRERRMLAIPAQVASLTGLPVVAVVDGLGVAVAYESRGQSVGAPGQDGTPNAVAGLADDHSVDNAGIASLATALAVAPPAQAEGSRAVAFTALRASHAVLINALAAHMRTRHASPVVESRVETSLRSTTTTNGDDAKLPGRAGAAPAGSVVLVELPPIERSGPAVRADESACVLLCVSAALDRGFLLRRAVRVLRAHAMAPDGIVLMRDAPAPDSRPGRRRQL